MNRVFALALAALLPGCAAPYAIKAPMASEDPARISEYETAMQQAEAELDQTLQVAARPECPRVCELQGNICKLAQKICNIASRNPQFEDLKKRCQDARMRCEAAQRKVAEHCECTTLDF